MSRLGTRGGPNGVTAVCAAALLAVLAGCADGEATPGTEPSATAPTIAPPTTAPPTTAPPSSTTAPTTTEPPQWQVGTQPLPLRPDGFGEVLPTPAELVDRRLPTRSALPTPSSERFEHRTRAIDAATAARMGRTWMPGCPVGLEDLRYLNVSFWGFDGGQHTGELVVHRDVADEVVQVFARLHEQRFPIEEMRLITDADLDAAPTGDGNNTAAFICRRIRQGSSWSAHAYGLAVDINPFHNPYRRDGLVLPELATAYLDRDESRPGMVGAGDVVTGAFAEVGWHWGGSWRNPDHMHFSENGR